MNEKARAIAGRLRVKAAGVGAAAQRAVAEAGRRTGDSIETTKLNVRIYEINSEINVCMRKLGELMYAACAGGNADDAAVDALLAEIDGKKAEAAELRRRISELKKERPCPVCGAPCGAGDRFCRRCGAEAGIGDGN